MGMNLYAIKIGTVISIVSSAIFLISGSAYAVPPGKTLEWQNPMGKVIFSGKIHADRGLACKECHPDIFMQKKGDAKFKMGDIKLRKFCGECHDGKKAFNASYGNNCMRCHNK